MSTNFQGRRRGKSVSFRGSSNDSNFYDSRPRNDSNNYDNRQRNQFRESANFEGSNKQYPDDIENRVVKLLPDANMTISVPNDFRGPNKSRGRGSRGILKSNSFRDDTFIYNRSSDMNNRSSEFNNRSNDFNSRPSDFNNRSEYDDYNSHSKRGFEAPFRSRGRARGFYNRSHGSKYQENEQEIDKEFSQGNDISRGRSKSAGERTRRGRGGGGRGRGRGKQFYRSSDDQNETSVSGDGDRSHVKEDPNNLEIEMELQLEENENREISVLSESCTFENTENEDKVPKTLTVSLVQEESPEKLGLNAVYSESKLEESNEENKESEVKSENPDVTTTDQA